MTSNWMATRWMLCAVLALGLAACSNCSGSGAAPAVTEAATEKEEDAIAVRTGPLKRETLSELYATTATLRADKLATVTARTEGVVQRLLVEEGDSVKAGQPLAELENEEQKIALERERTAAETLKREFERAGKLHQQGLMSDEEFETARRSAKESEHSADLAELQLERTTIRAPFSGRVLTRHIDPGATVGNGTAVFDLADLNPLYADIGVPERHIRQLSVGQEVRISADSFDLKTMARIERIAPLVDVESGTVKVTLAVHGQTGLRPGTFVRADVVIDTHEDTLVVQRAALVPEGRRWHMFRLNDAGTHVERIEVRRTFEEGDRVEIAPVDPAVPLSEGDRIVVVGASALSDGVRVDPGSSETAQNNGAGHDAS
ncbi:MAG: efflux RND transporter periplasmic adaptor subunit [Acidobacteria bacterium]|nr:efflux RND transporter periplasmic adaptor subunit [Acidobacteriota bacterium]NIM62894.1 efflux RND transporter periplasmic adaptor subunit [Acidobacteriota bacterium]NIO58837.1 efflux RND transporter periplasmic adaptor subunit [Acidobacteriota bacterium]NIQ29894.1 efflux RND transporter periplasmic adaptor subunit [Acidobacteriota bacterium]NIQ84618.1 efflux RND transporter periplasmic adaptor subunit [Acidobacteriota bacterium]